MPNKTVAFRFASFAAHLPTKKTVFPPKRRRRPAGIYQRKPQQNLNAFTRSYPRSLVIVSIYSLFYFLLIVSHSHSSFCSTCCVSTNIIYRSPAECVDFDIHDTAHPLLKLKE